MSEQDIYKELAQEEFDPAFGSDFTYEEKSRAMSTLALPRYKVWNPNPQDPEKPKTPGIVITTTTKVGEGDNVEYQRSSEVVERVRAVILFASHGRELCRGSGDSYRVPCQSHDGERPSLRVDQPLCRKSEAKDVAKIFSGWKGFDQAKVDAKVAEVTEGTGCLQLCGLKSANGFINLCKYAKKDEDTGQAPACKQNIFVHAYDIEREREFKMKLTGKTIQNHAKFMSPYHEFFKFLRSQGAVVDGKTTGLPAYVFTVELSSQADGAYFFLNVKDWSPIKQAENRTKMKAKALAAKEAYEKDAHRLSKEEYEKLKKSKEVNQAHKGVESQAVGAVVATFEPTPEPASPPKSDEAVSFDEDDIPF